MIIDLFSIALLLYWRVLGVMDRSFCPVGVDSQASIPVLVASTDAIRSVGAVRLSSSSGYIRDNRRPLRLPINCRLEYTCPYIVGNIPNDGWWYPQCQRSLHHITSQLLLIMSLSYPYHCWRQFTGWRHISSVLSSLHHFFPKRLAAMAAFPQQPQSIAIIGGGVAGLQALRALENLPELEKIVSYPLKTMDGTQHDWIILDRSSLFFSCRRWFVSSCSFNSHELTLTSTSSNIYYRSIAYEVLTWDDMGQFAPNWPNLDGFPLFCWSNFYVFWCWLFVVRWIPCFPPTSQ